MGDIMSMFGVGSAQNQAKPELKYTAPDIDSLFTAYRNTGQVPYSYYGQGAPTNATELTRVKSAYPNSFTSDTSTAQPTDTTSRNPISQLIMGLAKVAAPVLSRNSDGSGGFQQLLQALRNGGTL